MSLNENNAPDAFGAYAAIFRRNLLPAIVVPAIDYHPPTDIDDGAFDGTVGVFQTNNMALVAANGPWYPDYNGIVPVSAQPQIPAPEPWTVDDS